MIHRGPDEFRRAAQDLYFPVRFAEKIADAADNIGEVNKSLRLRLLKAAGVKENPNV